MLRAWFAKNQDALKKVRLALNTQGEPRFYRNVYLLSHFLEVPEFSI
jgi:hypothetical protein